MEFVIEFSPVPENDFEVIPEPVIFGIEDIELSDSGGFKALGWEEHSRMEHSFSDNGEVFYVSGNITHP